MSLIIFHLYGIHGKQMMDSIHQASTTYLVIKAYLVQDKQIAIRQ